ncbi:MAG TPA: putative metal-dependent hydrolase [Chitinophagaceae bacterium]
MDLRYPIGKYEPQPFSEKQKNDWLNDIRYLPLSVENAILNLDAAQLDTPYREGGWTVKQVVHHLADSHMNAYCRVKLALTEDNPTIKPYKEQLWAQMKDSEVIPVNVSTTLLHALHTRWNEVLINITDAEYNRTVFHPEHNKQMSLWYMLGMYSWHGRHHTAHITSLRERMKW